MRDSWGHDRSLEQGLKSPGSSLLHNVRRSINRSGFKTCKLQLHSKFMWLNESKPRAEVGDIIHNANIGPVYFAKQYTYITVMQVLVSTGAHN